MSIIYHSDCCPLMAKELAHLILHAYRIYYESKDGAPEPQVLTVDENEYRLAGVFRAKALPLSRNKIFGYVAARENAAFVIFRGTESASEWVGDSRFIQVKFLNGWGKVHKGFKEMYKTCSQEMMVLFSTLGNEIEQVYIAGHSLGGALSTLACAEIYEKSGCKNLTHYTYASPRVGDLAFLEKYKQAINCSYRFMNTEDIVITEPKAAMVGPVYQYAHVGIPFAFSHHGGSILDNHLLESYMQYL